MTHPDLPVANPSPRKLIVLAAVDLSSAATDVTRQAAHLAASMGASLHLVRIMEMVPTMALGSSSLLVASNARLLQLAWSELERLMQAAQPMVTDVHGHVAVGDPVAKVLQLATDLEADVLVIGTHDPSKLESALFGSVASELARKAPCPVFLVRPKRHKHPAVPEIEPPCPDCLATRAASHGTRMWCGQHEHHHRPPA